MPKAKLKSKTTSNRPAQRRLRVQRVVSLSFEVTAIIERKEYGVVYHDTILQHYVTGEKQTIRGKPWPVGAKVDFREIKTG